MRISRYVLFVGAILCLPAIASSTGLAARAGHRTYTTPSTHPMRTALLDNELLNRSNPTAFTLTRAAGAQYVRLAALWRVDRAGQPRRGFRPL